MAERLFLIALLLSSAAAAATGELLPVTPVTPVQVLPVALEMPPQAPAPSAEQASAPPGDARTALCTELGGRARSMEQARRAVEAERQKLAKERAELVALSRQIEAARAELRQETERLTKLSSEARKNPSATSPSRQTATTVAASPQQVEPITKMLKAMKPSDAANMLRRLDRPIASAVVRQMRPADAAKVMVQLEASFAAELMAELATPTTP